MARPKATSPHQAKYPAKRAPTVDSFANAQARLGLNDQNGYSDNLLGAGTYALNPVTRNRVMLEYAYRGSWIIKAVVEAVADDMTREWIDLESTMPPDDIEALTRAMQRQGIQKAFNGIAKWARLYGGCLGVHLVDGQDMATELRPESIGRGQYKGICVVDRWMVLPDLTQPVRDFGPDLGAPAYYEIVADYGALPRGRIHYSRIVRIDGVDLPYFQRLTENGWGLSVIEPLWDRLIAFDSATTGAAQLIFKAHLRTLKIKGLKNAIAAGGDALAGVVQNIEFIRKFQSFEGLTTLDDTDTFETHTYSFAGLPDTILRLAEQISGAAAIPLTRLFGQSPAGLNSTGDSDIRQYYDSIKARQESSLRHGVGVMLDCLHRSELGRPPERGFGFKFRPLWQLTETEKADIALKDAQAVGTMFDSSIIGQPIALKELRQSAEVTGRWSNITDEDIAEAELAPPAPSELDDPPKPGQMKLPLDEPKQPEVAAAA